LDRFHVFEALTNPRVRVSCVCRHALNRLADILLHRRTCRETTLLSLTVTSGSLHVEDHSYMIADCGVLLGAALSFLTATCGRHVCLRVSPSVFLRHQRRTLWTLILPPGLLQTFRYQLSNLHLDESESHPRAPNHRPQDQRR